MSSNNQNWEKVGKTKTSTKGQKKAAVDKMPKNEVEAEPLKVSKSRFDAFADKSGGGGGGNKKVPLQDQSNLQGSPRGKGKQKKSKKPAASSKYKYNTFAEAIHDVSVIDVYERANQVRKPHTIWQKAIAHDINETISCPDESPVLLEKDSDYPLSKVPKPIYSMLYKLFIDETSDVVRQLLFEHCLNSLIDCMVRDQPTWGYRLCIQILAHGAPKICIPQDYAREVEKMKAMVNTPKRCLSYMWALGQVGNSDPQCGMKVWLNMMLPMIGVKNVAGYVVHYIERLLSAKDSVARLSGSIDAEKFMEIMRWSFDSSSGLAQTHRIRLQEQHRPIRLIATGNAKTKVSLFETFLKTPPGEITQFRPQLMDIIFECMQSTQNCFKKWRELYTTSLPQTRILLEYLEENWVQAVYKLPPKHFKDTIRAFCITNTDEAAKSSPMASSSDFKPVNGLCTHMDQKLTEKSSRTLSSCTHIVLPILFALVAVALGFFVYDVRTQGGLYKSVTYKTLDDTGILKFLNQAWLKISTVLQHVTKWLNDNVPYYWARVSDVLGPYFSYIATLLRNFVMWLLEVTAPMRAVIGEYTKAGLILCEKLLQKSAVAFNNLSAELRPSLLALQTWIDAKALAIYSFIRGDIGWCCVQDAIVDFFKLAYAQLVAVWQFLWSYILYVFKIASDYISGENM